MKHDKTKKPHDKKSDHQSDRQAFEGEIKFVSCSPHGHPEGVVLEDGTFLKIPPHSLLSEKEIVIGAKVSGDGEIRGDEGSPTFHHVKLMAGKKVLADDSGSEDEREALKETHKKDLHDIKKTEAELEECKVNGVIAAVARKPKGEIDRILFADGTSIHISKDVKIGPKEMKEMKVGSKVEVKGESRDFGKMKFIKAESVSLR